MRCLVSFLQQSSAKLEHVLQIGQTIPPSRQAAKVLRDLSAIHSSLAASSPRAHFRSSSYAQNLYVYNRRSLRLL